MGERTRSVKTEPLRDPRPYNGNRLEQLAQKADEDARRQREDLKKQGIEPSGQGDKRGGNRWE